MEKISFSCRKCGHILILRIDQDTDADRIMKRIGKVSRKECPACGEEPYENWILYDVQTVKENK